MKVQEFLTLVKKPGRTNYFVVCSDDLGLSFLLPKALLKVASSEDINTFNAAEMTKERARNLEKEARLAPRGSSEHTHFFITQMQKLPTDSVGPLLKAVEEAKYARFVFQAQSVPRKIRTLMSRSSVVLLPFMPRLQVLVNLKTMHLDAKTAENLNLYDGTLEGTRKALQMKDTVMNIKREMAKGARGIAAIYTPDILGSLAFDSATAEFLEEEEASFLKRSNSPERKKLALLVAMNRL